MGPRVVFYSWQSDSDEAFNRSFIEECLKRAIRNLNRNDLSDLVIDRDTKNVPGMPDIGNTILEKIERSAVVVADLTLINPTDIRRVDERPVSNPNVLFELGYGFGRLGPQAMVGIFNTNSGETEELPFDLRPKRLLNYRLGPGDERSKVRTHLIDTLANAIKQCLGDTEEELTRRASQVHSILSQLWMFGTEIDDWLGHNSLPQGIQDKLAAAKKLPALMTGNAYPVAAVALAHTVIQALHQAVIINCNAENWPRIKDLISSVADKAHLIRGLCQFSLDQTYHDELVQRIGLMSTELTTLVHESADGQFPISRLETLSLNLRVAAFVELIPQHPQFDVGLKEVSLDLRRHVLRWATRESLSSEAIKIIEGIQERLTQLLCSYWAGDKSKQ